LKRYPIAVPRSTSRVVAINDIAAIDAMFEMMFIFKKASPIKTIVVS